MGKCRVVQSMTWLRRERSGASGAEAEGASPASSEELRGERRAPSSRSDTQRDFITPLACGCFFIHCHCVKKEFFFIPDGNRERRSAAARRFPRPDLGITMKDVADTFPLTLRGSFHTKRDGPKGSQVSEPAELCLFEASIEV